MSPADEVSLEPASDADDALSPMLRTQQSWRNAGWYGPRPLTSSERFSPPPPEDLVPTPAHRPTHQTARIDGDDQAAMLVGLAPRQAIRAALARPAPAMAVPATGPARFVFGTLPARDMDHFSRCAESVRAFFEAVPREHRAWLVAFDPSSMERSMIEAAVPIALRPIIRWLETTPDRSALIDLAHAAAAIEGCWLLLLGAAGHVAVDAQKVLTHYIARFPTCRFILPGSVAVDDRMDAVEWQRHHGGSDLLFETDFDESRLVAIRQDLLVGIVREGQRWPTGCGLYFLALRAAAREPLLFLPEYLYDSIRGAVRSSDTWARRQSRLSARRAFLANWADALDVRNKAGPTTVCSAPLPRRGVVIVRTQGRRLDLLNEALESIRSQTLPLTACVVVHGSKSVFDDVLLWLGPDRDDLVLLHAWESDRRRGYPLNVGLDFARENAERFDFFSFLDDDDILYPLYAERLAMALHVSRSDAAYGLANQRRLGEEVSPGHPAKPTSFLVAGNFIPIHAYAARISVLDHALVRFREDMHYLEDWDFLLTVLHEGLSLFHLPEVLCEYRIIGDGNVEIKSDPAHYSECEVRVLAMAEAVAQRLGSARFLRDIAAFDFEGLAGLAIGEIHHAEIAWSLFDRVQNTADV